MYEHTPGSWRPRPKPGDPGIISEHGDDPWSIDADGRLIAIVKQQGGEEEANARLIAGSPKLLAAAVEMLEAIAASSDDVTEREGQALRELRAAVIEARDQPGINSAD